MTEIAETKTKEPLPQPVRAAPTTTETPYPLPVRAVLVVASIALLWLALPPVSLAPLALLAPAPFLLALRGLSPREALRVGIIQGSLGAAANAHWFAQVFPIYFAIVLWLIVGLFPAVYATIYAWAARRGFGVLAAVAPSAWVAIEWFRSEGWHLKFAWFTLGHALAGDSILRQNADLCGVYGLSALAIITSFLLVTAIRWKGDGRGVVLGLVVFALPLVGYARGNRVLGFAPAQGASVFETRDAAMKTQTVSLPTLRVVAVQDEHADRLEPKTGLTRTACAAEPTKPDIILWPEDSFFRDWTLNAPITSSVKSTASLAGSALVFGSMKRIPGNMQKEHNAAVVLDPSGNVLGEYHKTVPVQFVEGGVLPGDSFPTFEIAGHRIGVMICYDGTYPFIARNLVGAGAEAILIPTMDVADWGRIQHAHHALFYPLRACELRRPIVRAASSGVSLALDAWGRELARVEPFDPGYLAATINPRSELTPYSRGGWLLPFVAIGTALLGIAIGFVRGPRPDVHGAPSLDGPPGGAPA